MKRVMNTICLMLALLVSGCMSGRIVTLENIHQHVDNYYQKYPTWITKKEFVMKGNATVAMTFTEVRLATSIRKINNASYPIADVYFNSSGCWIAKFSMRAGGSLSWTPTRLKRYSYGHIEVPEYTYYFKWDNVLNEYVCYDWVHW